MVSFRFKIASIVFLFLFSALVVAPAFAVDYLPGVTKGQFVKYGNFVGVGQDFQAYNNNDWMKYEVVNVNQSQVNLVLTGQFKNGTVFLGNNDNWIYDVTLSSTVNGTQAIGQNPVIPGKLTKYSALSPNSFENQYINDTQTKTYLGVSRQVNILNFTSTKDNAVSTLTYFYDKDSGILLEMKGEIETTQSTSVEQFSYVVVDTNIFEPQIGIPLETIYIAVAAAAIIVALITTIVVMKKTGRKRNSRNSIRRFR